MTITLTARNENSLSGIQLMEHALVATLHGFSR
jgi:hypothetical protein